MTTVIFVHGTGVRQAEYEETFELIKQKLLSQRPDCQIIPCLWGENLGTKLNADGASIPLFYETLAIGEEEEDEKIVLWEQLYRDPFFELRLLSLKPVESSVASPFEEQPGERLQSSLENLSFSPELQAKLKTAGIGEVIDEACRKVLRSQPFQEALENASEPLGDYSEAIARAITALAMLECEQSHKYPPILTDAQLRDEVVQLLSLAIEEADLGLGNWIGQAMAQLAMPMGTSLVKRKRGAVTEAISPIPCDIVLYQGRGERIRSFIKNIIQQSEPPIVLLAHSLGGIACVDLLVQESLPQVELLITVGSQAPFVYEINALSSLEFGEPLPAHFPNWLNIYDLRDFLSYIGAKIFPNKVQDVLVDNKQPFPRAHGAYWTNPATWKAIIPRLP